MATLQLPQAQQDSSREIAKSITITVGMVLLIVSLGFLTHRFRPTILASTFTEHPHLRGTRFEKDIERNILDTIPILRYDSNLQLSEPNPVVKTHDLVSNTTLLRREPPAPRDAVQNSGISATKDEAKPCSICISDFQKGDNVRILPCNHIYHRRCIDPWILNFAGPCPLCKKKLPNLVSSSLTPILESPERAHIRE